MIPQEVVYLVEVACLLITIPFAMSEASSDYMSILLNRYIDHTAGWVFRAFTMLVVWGAGGPIFGITSMVFGLAASALVFSIVLKLNLNRLRGFDYRYVAPWSNNYDMFFFLRTLKPRVRSWLGEHVKESGALVYNSNKPFIVIGDDHAISVKWFRDKVHEAGSKMYATESMLLLLVIVSRVMLELYR